MGHFNNTIIATGKNKRDAENRACDEFRNRMGERYDIRDVKAKYIGEVPPNKLVEIRNGRYVSYETVENPDAPKSEWLQKWEFDIHSHA